MNLKEIKQKINIMPSQPGDHLIDFETMFTGIIKIKVRAKNDGTKADISDERIDIQYIINMIDSLVESTQICPACGDKELEKDKKYCNRECFYNRNK